MSLGTPEIIFVIVAALIFLGPKDLPRIASKAGGWWNQFQRMKHEALSSASSLLEEQPKPASATGESQPAHSFAIASDDELLVSMQRALGNETVLPPVPAASVPAGKPNVAEENTAAA